MPQQIKGVPLAPLTGALDLKSSPDAIPGNGMRMRQNYQCVGQGKLRRGCGWDKFLNRSENYNNEDFHDQLLTFTEEGQIRQPVTLLFEAESSGGVRSFWNARQGAAAKLNQYSGNWRIIDEGFGGELTTSAAAPRFKYAQLGDYLAFTNDFDKPKYHILEQAESEGLIVTQDFINPGSGNVVDVWFNYPEAIDPSIGVVIDGMLWSYAVTTDPPVNPISMRLFTGAVPAGARIDAGTVVFDQALAPIQFPIPGLRDFPDHAIIGLTRAAVVWEWKNCIFFADVVMDNQRYRYRLVWSDAYNPLGFDPGDLSSITGFQDLDANETILGGKPSVNGFLIYTSRGIWEMTVVGGEQTFAFRRAYNGEDNKGHGLLKFPNTLINTIDHGHIYLSDDGIYQFSQFMTAPERIEWVDRAAAWLYGPDQAGYTIDRENCQVHISGLLGDELLIFTADEGAENECPNRGLRLNLKYEVADVIDHGFTALANHRPSAVPTIRDFILENNICTLETLREQGYDYDNEGLPRVFVTPTAPFTPTHFYTTVTQTITDTPDFEVEDWFQEDPSEHSLCALLGDRRIDDYCPKCEGPTLMVLADSVDWCLKQMAEDKVFYRERCVNPDAVGSSDDDGYTSSMGSYLLDGYDSILRPAPTFIDDAWIESNGIQLDYLAVVQAPPTEIGLRIGISAQVADPNWDTARIVWFQHSLQQLKVITAKTPAQHLADNTIPSELCSWAFLRRGKVLNFELKISGTGGDAIFSKLIGFVKRSEVTGVWQ
jgi:hypothetical protein